MLEETTVEKNETQGEDIFQENRLPWVGQAVRSKKYGTIWRVIEKRQVYLNADDFLVHRTNPAIYICFWRVQAGKLPGVGRMRGYAYTVQDNTFEANWEILDAKGTTVKRPFSCASSNTATPRRGTAFTHLMLPTDGSELSEASIRMGIRLAKSINARVTGISVMPRHYPYWDEGDVPVRAERTVRRLQQLAQTHLVTISSEAQKKGVAYDLVYIRNDCPYETIIRLAKKRGCDLIVMASHKRSIIRRLLNGSESQKLMAHTDIPVLVVRNNGKELVDRLPGQGGKAMFNHVMIPTDGSNESYKAIHTGVQLAGMMGAKITGISVVPQTIDSSDWIASRMQIQEEYEPFKRLQADRRLGVVRRAAEETGLASILDKPPPRLNEIDTSQQARKEMGRLHRIEANRRLEVIKRVAATAGTECETICEAGDHPHAVIIRAAAKRGCDLIVMASNGPRGIKGFLTGSETQKILNSSRIPVLVVQKGCNRNRS